MYKQVAMLKRCIQTLFYYKILTEQETKSLNRYVENIYDTNNPPRKKVNKNGFHMPIMQNEK